MKIYNPDNKDKRLIHKSFISKSQEVPVSESDKTFFGFDWILFFCVIGLMLFSIAFVYSASGTLAELRYGSQDKLFWNHSLRVLIAICVLILCANIDYRIWKKFSKPILFISILFLILVFFIGTPKNGAYRWIDIGPVNFQPSELAKFALVLILAVIISERQEFIKSFRLTFLPMIFWIAVICILIAIQPNFSTAIVIFLISMTLIFLGNANVKHITATLILSLAGALLYGMNADYRYQRILSYIENVDGTKETFLSPSAFQLQQALIAFGNGGLFGRGPGQSRQSYLFLPESYGDFIFSIIGEEYGFFGVIIILSIFAVIIYRGIKIALRVEDSFAYFLVCGIMITIAVYVFVSVGVNTGLLPTTGLPLPFISYGGTAVIFYAAFIGIVLNISKNQTSSRTANR